MERAVFAPLTPLLPLLPSPATESVTALAHHPNRRTADRPLRLERLEERSLLAVSVMSQGETASASGADDVAIWIHPSDPSQSLVIGAIKSSSTSLRTYNLAGELIQSVAVPRINNVDLRYNFPLNGQRVALLAGSNRASDSIALYQIDAQGQLQDVAARTISTGMDVYGCAMYLSVATGKYYAFVSSEAGEVQQWELFDNGAGKVDARMVRRFDVGSITEGMVADDILGTLYVGEEERGIWRYSAEPNGGATRTSVDVVGSTGLDADVEGLTIYYKPNGVGYLIASSQGSNDFAVYRREGANEYLGNFELIAGNGVDAVADTDGIDVTNFPLGPQFPAGMFVAQDSDENFKLARWDAVDAAFGELISSDGSWDPRRVGMTPPGIVSYLAQWKRDYGRSARSDITGDGVTDGADFLKWQRAPASANVVAATEDAKPTAMAANADVSEAASEPMAVQSVTGLDESPLMLKTMDGRTSADEAKLPTSAGRRAAVDRRMAVPPRRDPLPAESIIAKGALAANGGSEGLVICEKALATKLPERGADEPLALERFSVATNRTRIFAD